MLKLANVIVKGGDNWNTNYNIDRCFLRQARKIFQDPLIGNARAIHMKRIGKAFYIVQKQVCEGKDPFKMHPRKVACCVHRRELDHRVASDLSRLLFAVLFGNADASAFLILFSIF